MPDETVRRIDRGIRVEDELWTRLTQWFLDRLDRPGR